MDVSGFEILGFLLGAGLLILFVLFVIMLVLYLLHAFGLYRMAQNKGIENAWLAFIPILDLYIMGKIAGTVRFQNYEIPQVEITLPVGAVVAGALSSIDVIGPLLGLALTALYLLVLYNIYKKYKGKEAVLMTVLSFFLPFMSPIFLFMLRNNTPIE